jgi:F-type H+-transporting ATPase subunit epsilon
MSGDLPATFRLKVVTPRRLMVDAEAEEASLPGLDGLIGVLPGHRPLMIALGAGTISYRGPGGSEEFEVDGGYAEIRPEKVVVFTNLAPEKKPGT